MPKQSTIDTIAAGLMGFQQGREMKRGRELEKEKFQFQRGLAESSERRAESEETRRQREFTQNMLMKGYALANAKSDQEKSEKYQDWLETMSVDFGIPKELITEEAVKLKMDVEQSRASTAASKASTARSMAGLETEKLQQQGLRIANEAAPIENQLRKFGMLQDLGYEPAQSRVMEESGELVTKRPYSGRGGIDPNMMLDNLRQTMDRAVDLANKQSGRVPALNQVAEESVNRYFAMDHLLSGGSLDNFKPVQGMDFSEKFNLDDYMQVYKDLNPTGFAGMENTRPGFEDQSESLRSLIQLGVGDMLGQGQAATGTAAPQGAAPAPPMDKNTPLTEANVAYILSIAETDEERQEFATKFEGTAKTLGRAPSWNELYKETSKKHAPQKQPSGSAANDLAIGMGQNR